MDWGSLFASIYLLGVLFTAAVTVKPIGRIMGWERPGDHADADSANDARMIVAFAVCGVAAIWPLTLPMYIASRIIPASAGHDDEDHGVDLLTLNEQVEALTPSDIGAMSRISAGTIQRVR